MDPVVAPPLADEDRRRLLSLLESKGADEAFLHQVLCLCAAELGEEVSIAAYEVVGEHLERVGVVGTTAWPQQLDRDSDSHRLCLPGAELRATRPFPEGGLDSERTLLVELALRLSRYHRRLKQRDFDIKFRGVELEAFYDVGLAIASTLDLEALGEEILLRAVSLLDARRGALYNLDGDEFLLGAAIGGSARESLPLGTDPESSDTELLPRATHLLSVPVEIEGQSRGLLVVGDKESRKGVGPFSDDDRRRLAHLANQAALALEQARLHREALEKERLEREMELASQIQRGILPRELPDLPHVDLLGWTRPARHVGGDFYDVIPLTSGHLALVLADVSGKGVPAALLVSTIHSLLRSLLGRADDLDEICGHLDRHLLQFSAANKYATLFLVDLDPETGTIDYVNAGHNPALLVRADGACQRLDSSAFPVGLIGGGSYAPHRLVLEAGDLLCIYSDGLTEAESEDLEEYGTSRLAANLVELHSQPLAEIRDQLEARITEHTGERPQGDDQTVLLLRRV